MEIEPNPCRTVDLKDPEGNFEFGCSAFVNEEVRLPPQRQLGTYYSCLTPNRSIAQFFEAFLKKRIGQTG